VSRREGHNLVADGVQALELGSKVHGSRLLGGESLIEGGDADGVAGGNGAILLLVVQHKGEHAVEVGRRIDVMFEIQRNDDLAVGCGLEGIALLELLSDQTVVVDLAVDGQNNGLVGVGQGLGARLDTNDAETLMAEDCVVADDIAAPVGATVADLLRKTKSGRLELLDVGVTGKELAGDCGMKPVAG
jgi:hypothetical protein